jgi:hypothetical protein
MAAKKRTYNVRRISSDLSYTVQDVVDVLGVHPNTVRGWFRLGLPKIEERHPWLVHGSALIRFLGGRQKARKRPCSDREFYCMRCRAPRPAREGVADITILNDKKLILSALCPVCDCKMNRAGSLARLEAYRLRFCIQTIHDERIRVRSTPVVDCDFEKAEQK